MYAMCYLLYNHVLKQLSCLGQFIREVARSCRHNLDIYRDIKFIIIIIRGITRIFEPRRQ